MRQQTRRQCVAVLVASALSTGESIAAGYSLICQNPGREYNLIYNQGDNSAIIDPDSDNIRQPVLAVINSDSARLVILGLSQPGMVSVLHLRPYLKNDIYADGQLIQTDSCREAG